jgi:hypothetical protein
MNGKTQATKNFPSLHATATGKCFVGVCAVLEMNEACHVAIVGPTEGVLSEAWGQITDAPLKREALQRVAIFSEGNLSAHPGTAREMLETLKLVLPVLDAMRIQSPRCKEDDSLDIVALVKTVIEKAEAT